MIDLDSVIAAELRGEPLQVTVAGATYGLHPEMPWRTPTLIGQNDPAGAFASLVVDGDPNAFADACLADDPSWGQITSRLNAIYATGESAASQSSSTNGGRRSRPTSNASTSSTSAAS